MNEILSVVITAYNQEKYISDCIESVISQTYRNLDIIVVDDGSTDSTGKICDGYCDIDDRIRVIHKKNGGSVSSRKRGVLEARGEYITYIDGDDWLKLDHYEHAMNAVSDADILAFSLTCVYDSNVTEIIVNECVSGEYSGAKLEELKRVALYPGTLGKFGIFPSMCSKICRTVLVRDNMLNVDDDIRMGDDGACAFPSICDAKKIKIDNDIAGYMYRKNISGTITSGYSYLEFDRIEKLYYVLADAFTLRNAQNMMEQLPYYLAFLYRIEMVYELANMNIVSLFTKLCHISKIRKLNWVQYVASNTDLSLVDEEARLLIKNINRPMNLLISWYGKKIFNRFNSI